MVSERSIRSVNRGPGAPLKRSVHGGYTGKKTLNYHVCHSAWNYILQIRLC